MPTTRKLRIRHAGGSTTLEVPHPGTAGDVAILIASTTSITPEEQAWKGGFPPKPLKLQTTDALPSDIDLIHVSKGEPSIVDTTSPLPLNDDDKIVDEPNMTDPDGFVVRRVMDADNSCLFNSIGYVLEHSRSLQSQKYRRLVADAVLQDPITYNEAFLGKPMDEYAEWISKSQTWGGQIELSILSRLLKTEIASFDVIRNRHDVYGTEHNFKRRIMVIYDGIHYDALAFCFDPSLPEDMDVTQFSPKDIIVMERARQLCEQQHRSRKFTDTSSFTLRCLVCQEGLKGQAEAQEHAQQTGHQNFAEY
jgi:ubiquitin thioesterase OTU1